FPEALARLGAKLRDALHAPLSSEEASVLSATRAKDLDTAQTHAEGISRLRNFDYPRAQTAFESTLSHDPTFVEAEKRLIECWRKQGFRTRSRQATERLASRRHLLTSRQSEELASLENGPDARIALFDGRPDDEELGFRAAFADAPPKQELA